MQTNRNTELTPHEMLTGRSMPVPNWKEPHRGPSMETIEDLKEYMQQLTVIHKAINLQEKKKQQEPRPEPQRPVVPGDQVYVRMFRRKWHDKRREGPYKVTRATRTAVQVEGSAVRYHLNHCTRVAGPRPELTTTLQDEPVPAQQNEESQDPQETGGRDPEPNLESLEGTAGQKARPMVTKQLTAPEVMAPLLYLEKLPREDKHDLQDFAYTKECE
ncbi:hypothetical protein SKAU_G00403740 [Synaphobranchus kaupii]|uniref:Uncharacterized protein n=1 Tax=Synaphobranchus kaupii TaxID=118154 RepID=A0A9Q1E9J2_SYNKA|nr:hypothetical protein SKAU_G00403740 [Synaphobranchus kaupii]